MASDKKVDSAGGTVVSFSNTPQAKDDTFTFTEDSAVVKPGAGTILSLDVMGNDLGGNAKSLFSLDDGVSASVDAKKYAPADLTLQDTLSGAISAWEDAGNGIKIRINNGKVDVDLTSYLSARGFANLQALGPNDSINETFTYAIKLGNGTLSWASVSLNIKGTSDPAKIVEAPGADKSVVEAGGVANAQPGDPTASGQLIVTDPDAGQNKFQTPPSLQGTYGTFTFNANTGAWTYLLDNNRPATQGLDAGQIVTESLSVTSLDGSASYTIVVTVNGVNDAPVAVDDTASGNEDTTISGSVAGNDSDPDGDSLTYSLNGAAPAGLTFGADGSFSLNATNAAYQNLGAGESVDVVVGYTVDDGKGGTDTGQLTITVNGVNDAPVAADDTASGDEDTTISGSVAGNDSDPDGDSLTYALNGAAPAGLTFGADGSFSLDATNAAYQSLGAGESVDVVVGYTVDDGKGGTDTGQLTITVNGVNDAPVAADDTASGNEDSTISGSVAGNDSDPDGDSLTYALNGAAPAGLTFGADGSFSLDATNAAYQSLGAGESVDVVVGYTVDDGKGGTDTGQLTITVNGVNDAPVAADDTASGNEDTTISGSVAGNDSDPDGDSLTYTLNGAAPAGLTFGADGSFSLDATNAAYQSLGAGESVDVVVGYTVDDGKGGTDTGQLTITVNGVNDAPVAADDTASGNEDSTISGSVAGNDSDPDGDSLTYALNGAAPAGLTFGADGSFSLDATNAAYQSLGAGESVDVVVGYTVDDGKGGTDTGQLTITVNGVNDAPVAADDTASGNEDTTISGSVAGNDGDPDGDSLTYALNGAAPAGLTFGADGSFSLDATNAAYQNLGVGESVDVVVGYTVDDGKGGTDTGQLTITVNGVNDAPVAADDTASGNEDTTISGSVAGNDSDPDGDSLTYSLNGAAPAGLTFGADGSFSLNATNAAYQNLGVGESVDVVVGYTVDDGKGGTDTGQLTITVNGVNDAPVAADDTASGNEDTTISGSVAGNDGDPDGDSLTYALNGAAPAGLTFGADGSFSLNATNAAYQNLGVGESVDVVVGYTVDDGKGGTDTGQLTITVNGVNDAPVAADDTASGNEDTTISGSVAGNDSDPDGDSLTYALNGAAPAGLTFGADGSFSLDATNAAYQNLGAGESVDVVVGYTVDDGKGGTDTGQLTITVNGVNDAPVAADDTASGNEDSTISGSVAGNDSDPDGDSLTYALNGAAPAGLTFGADGSFSLDATNAAYQSLGAGESVDVVVGYTVDDGKGGTDTGQLTITVNGVNDAPVAADDTASGNEDSTISGSVAGNDSDPDGDSLTYALNGAAPAGLTFGADGSFSLDATNAAYQSLGAGESVDVVVGYTVDDGKGGTDTGQLTITVNGVNDAPVAADDTASGNEDTTISGSVAGNDSDPDGDSLTYSLNGAAPAGLTFGADGSFSLDATNAAYQNLGAGESVDVVVGYTVDDGKGGTDTGQLTITVNGVNDNLPPIITSDGGGATAAITVNENTTAVTKVTATDANADTLTYSLIGGADQAKFVINSTTGALAFVTAPNFEAPGDAGANNVYDVKVQVSDGKGGIDVQDIAVTVQNVNEPPTGINFVLSPSAAGGDNGNNGLNAGTTIGTFGPVGDPDNTAFTFSFQGPVPAGFAINPTTGVLTTTATVPVSDDTPYSVTVAASDGVNTFTTPLKIWVVGAGNDVVPIVNTGDIDIVYGSNGSDTLTGLGGSDALLGGQQDDVITGGLGADQLHGGAGADDFVYTSILESPVGAGNRDTILDFAVGSDDIILTAIDSNTVTAGNGTFLYGGQNAGTVANTITWHQSGGNTYVHGDVNGDTVADFEIELIGLKALTSGDFAL